MKCTPGLMKDSEARKMFFKGLVRILMGGHGFKGRIHKACCPTAHTSSPANLVLLEPYFDLSNVNL
jgi:hypothetical protein